MNDAETPRILANWRSDRPAACRRSRSCAPTPATGSRRSGTSSGLTSADCRRARAGRVPSAPAVEPLAVGTILLSRYRRLLQAISPLHQARLNVSPGFKLKRTKRPGWEPPGHLRAAARFETLLKEENDPFAAHLNLTGC